jgi:hypothetical protein
LLWGSECTYEELPVHLVLFLLFISVCFFCFPFLLFPSFLAHCRAVMFPSDAAERAVDPADGRAAKSFLSAIDDDNGVMPKDDPVSLIHSQDLNPDLNCHPEETGLQPIATLSKPATSLLSAADRSHGGRGV